MTIHVKKNSQLNTSQAGTDISQTELVSPGKGNFNQESSNLTVPNTQSEQSGCLVTF